MIKVPLKINLTALHSKLCKAFYLTTNIKIRMVDPNKSTS